MPNTTATIHYRTTNVDGVEVFYREVEDGTYKAKPAKVFGFHEIQDAHRLMESYQATGKIVVKI